MTVQTSYRPDLAPVVEDRSVQPMTIAEEESQANALTEAILTEVRTLSTQEISRDHRYYRDPRPQAIKRMFDAVHGFSPLLAGVLVVHRREDGTYWLLDGSHRLEVALKAGVSEVNVLVFEGLTLEEEAWAWELHNTKRANPYPVERFKAEIFQRRKRALEIREAVTAAGYALAEKPNNRNPQNISSIAALQEIWEYGGKRALQEQLTIMHRIWPGNLEATTANNLKAFFLFMVHHRGEFTADRLVECLSKVQPFRLRQYANEKANYMTGSVVINIYRVIVDHYNQGAPNLPDVPGVPGLPKNKQLPYKKDNLADAARENPIARLTEVDVDDIVSRIKTGESLIALAQEYTISKDTIDQIVLGRKKRDAAMQTTSSQNGAQA